MGWPSHPLLHQVEIICWAEIAPHSNRHMYERNWFEAQETTGARIETKWDAAEI